MTPDPPFVDVRELIDKYTVEELNRSAEEYFSTMPERERVMAKPFSSSNDATHLLVQVSYLIQGLELYPGMRVLDFGCGPGWASRMLNQMGFEVMSLDVSSTALEMARQLAAAHPVFGNQPAHTFHRFDGHRIPLEDESVDRIFCLDAFHHVPNQAAVLAEMARVLRGGGIAGFAEPGPNHSRDPSSQLEMRNYKVIENDIVLEDIQRIGFKVGFTNMNVSIGSTYPLRVSLEQFAGFPNDANLAREFLRATNDRIKNYPIFFLHKGVGGRINDSREMDGLAAQIEAPVSATARAGGSVTIPLVIANISTKKWLPSGASPGSVNIGYFVHALDTDAATMAVPQFRASLSREIVPPGGRIETSITIDTPRAGHYRIDIDLVSEHVRWFQANGSRIASVQLKVT